MTPDEFLKRVFAPPNIVWPNIDVQHPAASGILPFLDALSVRGECPVVLPRRDLAVQPFVLYVMCWDTAHAGRVRPLLEAAVAHQYCHFDGRVARLNPRDPIETAILDYAGPGATFILRPERQTQAPIVKALGRLVRLLRDVPLREPQLAKPVGRMLREFDLALAAGSVDTSASILKQIEGVGGISHENVAFLRVRRLSQLGLDQELLAHPSMPTLVVAEPPRLVREAVLGAWARVHILPALAAGVEQAMTRLSSGGPDFAMLLDERLVPTTDPDVATVGALIALARGDRALISGFAGNGAVASSVTAQLHQSIGGSPTGTHDPSTPTVPTDTVPQAAIPIGSWLDWASHIGTAEARSIDAAEAKPWPAAWRVDDDLAYAVDGLGEVTQDDLLPGLTRFLETDDPQHPAGRTAHALITRYLVSEWFGPADLSALCSLVHIFLRSAPDDATYRSLLHDIQSYAPRWISVASAVRVLDLADAIVCGPSINADARLNLVTTLLAPLQAQRQRLTESDRVLAELITSDVGLPLDWSSAPRPIETDAESDESLDPVVLLYSLETGTLRRAKVAVNLRWPEARVTTSFATVGDAALLQHARGADIVVLATRRAAHAATTFIMANRKTTAKVAYPDGSGSASMMRAVETAISEWSG